MLFLIVLFFWRYVSLASISAAAAMPLLIYLLWAPHHAPPLIVIFGSLAAAVIIIYKHDANIQRLVQGEEPKFSLAKKRDSR
jgi:glycerol-3-phosphate acyltransferase PlsY